ncbi:zinc finger MYM-type protein 5-like [Uranotaenia lowii]|uniref:zinc finger MYM-type protein 5-like n=1 Tax=Uranotaenia lowii TaxID=190385 RepID=UPI0024796FF7|nr:zinc finger MYM-type protein 5-like [Uranotaenia lowii]
MVALHELDVEVWMNSMPRKNLLSGALKRKIARERDERLAKVVSKTISITTYFANPLDSTKPEDVAPSTSQEIQQSNTSLQIAPEIESTSSKSDEFPSTSENVNIHEKQDTVEDSMDEQFNFEDPATWFPVRDKHLTFWSIRKEICNNNKNEADLYPESKRVFKIGETSYNRFFNNSMFYLKHENGELHLRKWLIYSKSKGSVYCFYCVLGAVH